MDAHLPLDQHRHRKENIKAGITGQPLICALAIGHWNYNKDWETIAAVITKNCSFNDSQNKYIFVQ
jgi:hypothetical protein